MESNKSNKVTIIILMIFIVSLILMNFIFTEPKYEITIEIIICICLLVILSLSEMFDNLSIPKVISLSKNIREIKKENDDLKNTNIKLLEQMTNIKNTNSQNIIIPNSFNTISSSNIDDINKNDDEENIDETIEKVVSDDHEKYRKMQAERHKYRKNIEIFMLKKVLSNFNENENKIQYDVKLINNKLYNDKIMKNEARFDAMSSNKLENIFYEVKISPFVLDYSFELHYMLRTLELYQESNNILTKLILLLPKLDNELESILFNSSRDRFGVVKDRIEKRFEPAVENKLLEIVEVEVSKQELDNYIKEKEDNK